MRRHVLLAAPLLLLPLALTGISAAQDPPSTIQTVSGKSQPIYTENIQEEYRVETDHGTIFGLVSRPVVPDGVKVPVILTYSPYNSLSCPSNEECDVTDAFFNPRGYARARFDVVGTRESSGCYDYGGIRERETGAAIVEFLATQPWASGKVGMIGGSYDGTTQLAAAVEAPPHLTTIVPQVAIDRWYDYAYGQGVRYFLSSDSPTEEGFDTPLAFDFGFGLLPPADPSNPGAFVEALVDRITPCDRIEHTEKGYETDPVYDEFWDERDYRARAGRVKASVLIEGGWQDDNVKHWGSTRFFQALPAGHPKRLVIGQWPHSASRFDDARDIRHAWFDHWLLGLDTGVMSLPAVDTQPANGERVQHSAWPPPGTREVPIPLVTGTASIGELALTSPDSTYTDDNPALTEDDVFAGSAGNAALLFRSEPLPASIRISGPPQLELAATTDDTETHVTPVLADEDPEGEITVITRGFLNARNRESLRSSTSLTPGAPYSATVDMWDTDYIVPSGHRLLLAVSAANAVWALSDETRATTTLHLTAADGGPSTLVLPVSSGAVDGLGAAPVDGPAPAPSPAPRPPAPGPLPATGAELPLALAVAGATAALAGLRRRRRSSSMPR